MSPEDRIIACGNEFKFNLYGEVFGVILVDWNSHSIVKYSVYSYETKHLIAIHASIPTPLVSPHNKWNKTYVAMLFQKFQTERTYLR